MTEPDPGQHVRTNPPASWEREPGGEVILESNWLFELRKERFRSRKSLRHHDFFVVDLADAVNVIAVTRDRRILLVEQFRAGSGRDSLEPPGGLLDPGEDPLVAGVRELREETGFEGDEPILINTVWACPSLLTSRISTILVRNARKVSEPKCDEGEELRLVEVSLRDLPGLIRDGRIGHALAVQGLLWWLVSELPDTPFERPEVFDPGSRQFRIGGLMVAVAIVGVMLGMVRQLVQLRPEAGVPMTFLLLLIPSYLLVLRLVDPMPRTTLTRSLHRLGRRSTMRTLATLGLALLLTIVSSILLYLSR